MYTVNNNIEKCLCFIENEFGSKILVILLDCKSYYYDKNLGLNGWFCKYIEWWKVANMI